MAKYSGMIGYASLTFDGVDKYTNEIVERKVHGDLLKDYYKQDRADKVIDDINIINRISIVADPYASKNFHSMKYATYMGTKWKITSVEVSYPRLILTLGGEYNE